jgi:hypothetical protein
MQHNAKSLLPAPQRTPGTKESCEEPSRRYGTNTSGRSGSLVLERSTLSGLRALLHLPLPIGGNLSEPDGLKGVAPGRH